MKKWIALSNHLIKPYVLLWCHPHLNSHDNKLWLSQHVNPSFSYQDLSPKVYFNSLKKDFLMIKTSVQNPFAENIIFRSLTL